MAKKSIVQEKIESFLNTGKGNKVLQYLSTERVLGWEKWLQYELAFALTDLGSPETEVKFQYDKRVKISVGKARYESGFIDIVFRKKSTARQFFTALELKIGSSDKIVRSLLSDLIKVGAKKGSWNFRSVMAVGVFREAKVKNDKFSKGVKELLGQKGVFLTKIKNTDFKMISMAWRVPPRSATRENYREWLSLIEKNLKGSNVRVKKKKVVC